MLPEPSALDDLSSLIDTEKYLRPTSDIAALMVLEHQCRTHNLMTKAKMTYERAVYFQESYTDDELGSEEGMAWKTADSSGRSIAAALLFKGEAKPGEDGVEGAEEFLEVFEKRAVRSHSGEHLRELRLDGRMFQYRCSYMIHSKAFRILPTAVMERVFHYLRKALEHVGEDGPGPKEKSVIRTILEETVPGFKKES